MVEWRRTGRSICGRWIKRTDRTSGIILEGLDTLVDVIGRMQLMQQASPGDDRARFRLLRPSGTQVLRRRATLRARSGRQVDAGARGS